MPFVDDMEVKSKIGGRIHISPPKANDLELSDGFVDSVKSVLRLRPGDRGIIEELRETIGPVLRTTSLIGSFISNEGPSDEFDRESTPGIDIEQHMRGYEDHPYAFVRVNSVADIERVKRNIDRQRADLRAIEGGGLPTLAAVYMTSLAEPAPVFGYLAKIKKLAKLWEGKKIKAAPSAKKSHISLVRGRDEAVETLIDGAASEFVLQSTQDFRTLEDAVWDIGGAVAISGVLGSTAPSVLPFTSGAPGMAKEIFTRMSDQADNDVDPVALSLPDMAEPGFVRLSREGVASDLERVRGSKEGTSVPGGIPEGELDAESLGLAGSVPFSDPLVRLATSPSIEARRTVQGLAETPYSYEPDVFELASSPAAETRIKMWIAPLTRAIDELERLYVEYRTGIGRSDEKHQDTGKARAHEMLPATVAQPLTFLAFKREAGRALRRGDQHHIPEVADAARSFRGLVFEELKDRAVAGGLLPSELPVETAISYLTRLWNAEQVQTRKADLVATTVDWLRGQRPELAPNELDDIARQISDSLAAVPNGRIPYEDITIAGQKLENIAFVIPNEAIETFLESDIETLARSLIRTIAPDVELSERFGSADLTDQVDKIALEYEQLIDNASSEHERRTLALRRESDVRDVEILRDRLRGRFAAPRGSGAFLSRSSQFNHRTNFSRLFGGASMSNVSDIGRTIILNGVASVMLDGLVPLVQHFNSSRIAANEAGPLAMAWSMVLNSRASSLADIGDDFGSHAKFNRTIPSLTDEIAFESLMRPWQSAVDHFTGAIVSTRILQAATNRTDSANLSEVGVGQDMALRIADQFKKHGELAGDIAIANVLAWDDREAAAVFRAAVQKETDVVSRKNVFEASPLWMSDSVFSMIRQFRSYAIAATQRVVLAGLPQREAATINGLLLSTAIGLFIHAHENIKDGTELSDSPNDWLAAAVDRAEVADWLFDLENVLEAGSRGTVGIEAVPKGPLMSKLMGPEVLDIIATSVFGPGYYSNTSAEIADSEEFDGAAHRKVRRLLPYQNLFYIRALFDKAINGLSQTMGETVAD